MNKWLGLSLAFVSAFILVSVFFEVKEAMWDKSSSAVIVVGFSFFYFIFDSFMYYLGKE